MTMSDAVDLNFLARQSEKIINDVGFLRDENRVLTGICMRLESAQPAMVVELRALQSLIGRVEERFRKWETDGMPPEQADTIANRLQPRLLDALTQLITHKLLVVLDGRFQKIERELAALNQRLQPRA
jgi:hypothetical protein